MKKKTLLNLLALLCIISFFVIGVWFVYTYLPVDVEWSRNGPASAGVDWKVAFRPATLELLRGHTPYGSEFFNPPWVLLPLIPIALLSPALGAAVMYVLNLFCFLFVAAKLRMNPIAFVVFILFSGIIYNSTNGNVEGIAALGFILPPQIGLFFVLAKPQFGLAVAAFWAVEAYRAGGVRDVVTTFLPVAIGFLLSVLVFGPWFLTARDLTGVWWNASDFPYDVPVGVVLLGLAVWRREVRFAIAASPYFAPYLTGHTWAVTWLGLLILIPTHFPINLLSLLKLTYIKRIG